ncbi:hypothetical protein Golob_026088 [Gossypium lobatum]|uniref:Uncharacterized protein n=1 Tax=Gossypium lobatum TaxID=34289 RepID=A0A7J8LUB5_9ROSI|nr:hypothetical protein [Gossypium lobatum]
MIFPGIYLYLFLGVGDMNWVQRKIYLYNVTFGLYMLDWWERYLFSILFYLLFFLNHGRHTGYCVDVVHLLQQLAICNGVLQEVDPYFVLRFHFIEIILVG